MPEGFAFIKVYWISSDPLLRTWISGAKSYLDPVKPGSSVPGFGVAKVLKITKKKGKKTIVEVGDWVVGMLEWSEYMMVDYKIIQKLPLVLKVSMHRTSKRRSTSSLPSMGPLVSLPTGPSSAKSCPSPSGIKKPIVPRPRKN